MSERAMTVVGQTTDQLELALRLGLSLGWADTRSHWQESTYDFSAYRKSEEDIRFVLAFSHGGSMAFPSSKAKWQELPCSLGEAGLIEIMRIWLDDKDRYRDLRRPQCDGSIEPGWVLRVVSFDTLILAPEWIEFHK